MSKSQLSNSKNNATDKTKSAVHSDNSKRAKPVSSSYKKNFLSPKESNELEQDEASPAHPNVSAASKKNDKALLSSRSTSSIRDLSGVNKAKSTSKFLASTAASRSKVTQHESSDKTIENNRVSSASSLSSKASIKNNSRHVKPFLTGRASTTSNAKAKSPGTVKESTTRYSSAQSRGLTSSNKSQSSVKHSSVYKPPGRPATTRNSLNVTSTNKTSPLQHASTKRKSSKGLPPTAVVAPIQDKSKVVSPKLREKVSSDVSMEKDLKKPPPSPLISDFSSCTMPSKDSSCDENIKSVDSITVQQSEVVETKQEEESEEFDEKMLEIGHYFKPFELKRWVNWCDACGGVIISMFSSPLVCKKCNMLCHGNCVTALSLTCAADEDKQPVSAEESDEGKPVLEETKDEATLKEYNTIKRVLPADEVQEKINLFNQTVKGIQQMTLQEDGETFRGFIRVSMNLMRPVSVSEQFPKLTRKGSGKEKNSKSSFYVDKGALKALHVTSEATAESVVKILLTKYNITDNPMKFALYEKHVKESDHVVIRKMLPRERPLLLRLLWGHNSLEKEFILQENETRDIEWEAFSVAELQMFIKILNKEENDYVMEIKKKYKNRAEDIKKAMEYQSKV